MSVYWASVSVALQRAGAPSSHRSGASQAMLFSLLGSSWRPLKRCFSACLSCSPACWGSFLAAQWCISSDAFQLAWQLAAASQAVLFSLLDEGDQQHSVSLLGLGQRCSSACWGSFLAPQWCLSSDAFQLAWQLVAASQAVLFSLLVVLSGVLGLLPRSAMVHLKRCFSACLAACGRLSSSAFQLA